MVALQSEPLKDLLSALGLGIADCSEDGKKLTVEAELQANVVIGISFEVVKRFKDSYGGALELAEVNIHDVHVIEMLTQDFSESSLQMQKQALTSGDRCTLRISIDKRALAQSALAPDAAAVSVFFFFAEALERFLARDILAFENSIWGDVVEFRRILVGDLDIQRAGIAFEIVGTSQANVVPPARSLPTEVKEYIKRMRDDRDKNVSLEPGWLRNLTPLQVNLDGDSKGTRLEKVISCLHIRLCLLYLCDRARYKYEFPGRRPLIQVEYGPVKIYIPEIGLIYPNFSDADEVSGKFFEDLVDWCYQSRIADSTDRWFAERLELVRVRLAHELEPYLETDRVVRLIGLIKNVSASVESHWRAFIEGRLSKYIEEERKLEGIVTDAVRSAGERSVALTKSLTDTMLSAVAAIIGAAIAAAFKSPFDGNLFTILVASYAAYVFVFPGLYGVTSQVFQYLDARNSFAHDKRHFIALLGDDRVSDIVEGRDVRSGKRYWWIFGFTVLGFALAIAAAGYAASEIPSAVK